MRPIIEWGLRGRRWTIVWWSVGIGAYIALNVLVYGSIRDQAQTLNEALASMPESVKTLLGGGTDFLSPVGYLNSKLYYLILPLLFTMLTVTTINNVFSKEEQNGTLELLLARPISRAQLMLAKQLTATLIVLAVAAVALVVTALCVKVIDYDMSLVNLTIATAASALMGLLFGSVAWALLGLGRLGRRASLGAAAFVAFGSYLVTSLESYADYLAQFAKILPYHYYEPAVILQGTYHWGNLFGLLLATTVLMALGLLGFRRRDIG